MVFTKFVLILISQTHNIIYNQFEMQRQVFQNTIDSNKNQKGSKTSSLKAIETKRFNQLQICRPYPLESVAYYRIAVISLQVVFCLQMLVSYSFLTVQTTFVNLSSSFLEFQRHQWAYAFYGLIFFIKLIVIGNIFLQIILSNRKQSFKILASVTQKLKRFLRLAVEIDYQISSVLALSLTAISIINFVFSIAVIVFSIVFLENYNQPNDKYYVASFSFLVLFRITQIGGALINVICLFLTNAVFFFLFYHTAVSVIILVVYFKNGWIIYKDAILRWSLLANLSLYLGISINLVSNDYSITSSSSFAIQTVITFIILTSSLILNLKNQQQEILSKSSCIKSQQFVLFNILESSNTNDEQKLLIASLLKFHTVTECTNDKCFTYTKELYDSKNLKVCKSDDFINQRSTILKFYIQCKHEQYLSAHPKDDSIILSYCELLYWRFRNIGRTMYWLEFLKRNIHYFSLSSLIKFNGLIEIVKEDSQRFCRSLYNRNVDIEHLIDAESTYQVIASSAQVVIQENLQIWKLIQKQEIDLSEIQESVAQNFQRTKQISENWKKISSFLKYSSVWKQQYIIFVLYIRNEKMKNRLLQEFDAILEKNIDIKEFIGNSKNNFELKTLLGDNTCCIHVFLNDKKALIKRVSNNFHHFTGYTSLEVLKADIDILLPRVSKKSHQQTIQSLYNLGKFLDESLYIPNEIHIINKSGYIIPAFKIFKEFVTDEGELEYVCFLKKIQEKQITIICDQHFEIDSFTNNFAKELEVSSTSTECMKHINLLSMIPELASKGVFSELVAPFQKNTQVHKEKAQEEVSVNFFYTKDNIQRQLSYYQYMLKDIDKSDLKQYYKLIKEVGMNFRVNELVFKCNITINYRSNLCCNYYQIKINQIHLRRTLSLILNKRYNLLSRGEIGPSQSCTKEMVLKTMKAQNDVPTVDNIFIKEETNEAPNKNFFLNLLKYIWIILTIILVVTNNVKLTFLSSCYQSLQQHTRSLYQIMQFSGKTSSLVNYYQSLHLGIRNRSDLQPLIQANTQQFEKIIRDIKQDIFDKASNQPFDYYPLIPNQYNGNLSYNQIDLPFFMQSQFHSLVYQFNLTEQSDNYYLMKDYFFPSFIQMINSTKLQLHDSFNNNLQSLSQYYIIIFSLQMFFYIVLIICTTFLSLKFHRAMEEMMKVHCHFSPQDINKIIKYYEIILKMSQNIQHSSSSEGNSALYPKPTHHVINRQRDSQITNNNLNKKSKNINLGKKQGKNHIYFFVKVFLNIALLICFTFSCNIYLNSLVEPISTLEADGFNKFIFLPTQRLSSLVISNKYLNSSQYIRESFRPIFNNLKILSQTPYMGTPISNSNFYRSIKQFQFENVCQFNLDLLLANNLTLKECETVANRSFTRGIVAFAGFQYRQISKIYTQDQEMTMQEISEYYKSLYYFSLFLSHLVGIWSDEITRICSDTLSTISIMMIAANMLFLFVVGVVFFILFQTLDKQYRFYRQFYRIMMPDFIISEEKIIKSKLTVISFL